MIKSAGSSSSSLAVSIMRTQSEKNNALYTALRQCWTVPRCQISSSYVAILVYFHWPGSPFLGPTLDNGDPLRFLFAACRGGGSRPS